MEEKKHEHACCHDHHHEHPHHAHDHHHDHEHHHDHDDHHDHEHEHGELGGWAGIAVGAVMLVAGLLLNYLGVAWFQRVQFWFYAVAVFIVGWPVMKEAVESSSKGDVFSEFTLMSVAALGALFIGEYPEAVAVLLLYCIGEALQDRAVDKARQNIESLVAVMPTMARVVNADGTYEEKAPKSVKIGDFIEVRPGERVPLDGVIDYSHISGSEYQASDSKCQSQQSQYHPTFNTAALTGESMPRTIEEGQEVMAGMIAYDQVVRLRVVREEQESAVMRILHMVQDATERKSPSELFIRRFARVYTPIVILLAVLTVVLPWVWSLLSPSASYVFSEWLHRALVFLVISCPCALVISIPLSYFAGIGAASRVGILFKGSNYLDAIADIDTLVFDKTGTLTTGEFQVKEVVGLSDDDFRTVALIEQSSNHPIAKAIVANSQKGINGVAIQERSASISIRDRAGYGMEAKVNGEEWLVGTTRLLDEHKVNYPEELKEEPYTFVACAKNGGFIGKIVLSDTLKDDAREAVSLFNSQSSDSKIKTIILSGDKQMLVSAVAQELGADEAYGDLLPEDKLAHIEHLQTEGRRVAFVGDGINDAPVLAVSNVGIAMGALGSDMAVETADVVIQTDQPSKVLTAIGIGRRTRCIVKQNVVLALGVKAAVMILGLFGIATLWEAVFADSGVALLAVLNAMRVMRNTHSVAARPPVLVSL